ncbi:hypothetical protein QQX98_012619 [Neonectria punicea]|uniref:Methyltransferase n=1 Tax=Neonectria punicea TaxID=979145 RepID=A0ABR1GIN7_9HYPO
MMYTRVTEIEEINNKTQKPQLHKRAPRFGEPSFKPASSVKVGGASGRKRPFTDENQSNEHHPPRKRTRSLPGGAAENKVGLDPESDEDDVNGLVRVKIVSKKRRWNGQQAFLSYCSPIATTFENMPNSELATPAWKRVRMTELGNYIGNESIHSNPEIWSPLHAPKESALVETPAWRENTSTGSLTLDIIYGPSEVKGLSSECDSDEYVHNPSDEQTIQGRTFQRQEATQYRAPVDEEQQESQEPLHYCFLLLMDDQLFQAPINETSPLILDIGAGTGTWAVNMADNYPSAKVYGTDINAIQPKRIPPNCSFFVEDAQLEWMFSSDAFDFVHIRALYGAIDDWAKLYRQAYKVLAPGGWLEHFEFDITLSIMFEATDRIGKTARIGMDGNMRKHMEKAGFVDIVEKTYKMPCGEWARDPKLKSIGLINRLILTESLEGTILFLLREVLAWEFTDIRQFVERMRSALQDTDLRSYCIMTNVYARKPDSVP